MVNVVFFAWFCASAAAVTESRVRDPRRQGTCHAAWTAVWLPGAGRPPVTLLLYPTGPAGVRRPPRK